jgi:N-hydroxyarylamine O-acetyltransferase
VHVRDYLDRIHANVEPDSSFQPTLEVLSYLHERHLCAAPFENLDIHFGVPIVVDQTKILEKIVTRNRGGFCYELNGAFAWLLTELGYDVTLLSAAVARADGGFGIAFDHMALRVDIEGAPWLADVGFGDSFVHPIPLIEKASDDYHLDRDGEHWTLKHESTPKYRFTLTPRRLSDFEEACHYQQTSPESTFTQRVVTTRLTPEGRVTLTRERLILHGPHDGGGRVETKIDHDAEWRRALAEHFDIVLENVS